MKIEYLLHETSEWLKGTGPAADIILSSRIRLARNLKGKNFIRKSTPEERREVFKLIAGAVEGVNSFKGSLVVELDKVSDLDRQFLVERRLLGRELSPSDQGAVIISEQELISVIVNEEDHLRLQVIQSGMRLFDCWRLIDRVDTELEEKLAFEFSPRLGYLTACPTNVGTGIRASVMLHLPALVLNKQIGQILQAVGKLGLAVRGMYGEGSQASGNIFQISNQATLGKSEEEIVRVLEQIINKLINHENIARAELLKGDSARLEDRVYRALGILKNVRLVSFEETVDLLSGLRMGVDLGIIDSISRQTANEIFIFSQPAHLQKMAGKTLSPEERDLLRARLIRDKLSDDRREVENKDKTESNPEKEKKDV